MFRFYPISRFAVLATAILVSLFLAISPASAVDFSAFKLPGGVHHKTIFIDFDDPNPDYHAVASVCMSDKLSIKKFEYGSWADEWTQIGDFTSTWGLDWARIFSAGNYYPYVVFSGDHRLRIYRYQGGSWEEIDYQDPNIKNTDFHVQESVFYPTENSTYSPDRVLICQTQIDEGGPTLYGLHKWNGATWQRLDETNPYISSEGYGYRMWRNLADGRIIYMTHENQVNGNNTIAFLKVEDIDDGNFIPTEIMTGPNLPDFTTVNQAPSFFQWKEGNDVYQYIVASTNFNNSEETSIDVWFRVYENNSSEWEIILHNIDAPGQLEELGDANHNIQSPVAIAARNIPGTDDHRVYLATREYGLTAYNTINTTQTAIDLSNIDDDTDRLHTFQFRYLDICPFASTSTTDVVFYSYDDRNKMIEVNWKILTTF